jgi:hypothetical protein
MRPVAQNGSELPLSGEFLEKKVLCSPLLHIPFFASHFFFAVLFIRFHLNAGLFL